MQFWAREIEELSGRRFESIAAVVDELVQRVCDRLAQPSEREELREFLTLLLDTDEVLRDQLAQFVK